MDSGTILCLEKPKKCGVANAERWGVTYRE
mgnify:CR=1